MTFIIVTNNLRLFLLRSASPAILFVHSATALAPARVCTELCFAHSHPPPQKKENKRLENKVAPCALGRHQVLASEVEAGLD